MKKNSCGIRELMTICAACLFASCGIHTCAAQETGEESPTPEKVNQQEPGDEAANEAATELAIQDEFKIIEYPIAIIPFQSRGKEVEGMGEKVSDLMFAELVVDPMLFLVDREEMDTMLSEAELNLSALVDPGEAIQVGQITGAKLLVTGSVFQVDETIYVVAKIIGTETTRVVGASAKGVANETLGDIVKRLGDEVIASIKSNSDKLVARPVSLEHRIENIKESLNGKELPSVLVSIEEQHVGERTIDPAAETEMISYLQQCGFEVIDKQQGSEKQADVLITGEGFSEFATRTSNLISVKARLEVKIVDRISGKVIAVDRQTRLAVGLAEQVTAKLALEQCAADIAERILPRIIVEDE